MLLIESAKLERVTSARPRVNDLGDLIASRLKFFADDDQLLVEMIYRHNLSRRQIGRLIKRSAGAVTRRVQTLVNRLHDPLVIALTEDSCTLPTEYREVGIQYFLQGASVPLLMRQNRRTRREIEAMMDYVRGWHRGISGK